MYEKDAASGIGRKRPITPVMLDKFAPYGKIIEETNLPPKWLPSTESARDMKKRKWGIT
tara:strand:+ start:6824 stop:7000 length:177 start_codon:yes stop_codon:yes gene_type:complete